MAYFDPRRVILFGSHARGEAGPDSDIDLLVVVDDDVPAEKMTLDAAAQARSGYHRPADIIPVREEKFRRMCGIPGTLSRAAWLEGVTVYEKVHEEMTEPEPDPVDWRNNVFGWIKVARADMQVARACLEMVPPQPGVAAYHCQQAAEKVLKGFLVLANVDFSKTHDLDDLGASVVAAYPATEPLVAPLRGLTKWGIVYRYPDMAEPPPEPSADELSKVMGQIERLADTLEAEVPSPPTP